MADVFFFVNFSPNIIQLKQGTKIYERDSIILTSLTCTPRLMAKMLTAKAKNMIE